ncbi:acylneuraminate cytidylyltransferase family protein [Fusobacterium varium]|uniref:acylneuraminate cytidylyltransferase family protein n=1 Tax=Fusobacterium varium TaxID=856 RepID=UPI000E40D1D1|nr:acylneuraminate cytidylyltransferase family protein [Fusobacterium varium]MCI6033937.1 acylneuraminate cytidylyltransferase family protein [Fusobacterium varium]RGJ30656.1 acylneuraminate cytidylyltransferase family protein [Fusobacterium varium]
MKEKILAIIPARSGSKGLKDKNIKMMNGKPLIAYTIEVAKKSKIFEDIIISTDSEKYAEIVKKYGGSVPYLRDKKLANDNAKSSDVILDILNRVEKRYDSFIMLQPTSPLRTEKNIMEAYKMYLEKKANSVVSVCEMEHSPLWANILNEEKRMDSFLRGIDVNGNRQELETYYRINGALYIANVEYFKKYQNFYYKDSYAYIMEKENSIDIDDELDFKIAEYLIKNNRRR